MNINVSEIISKSKITIMFQPVISANSKKIVGYEALARGIDEKEKLIQPIDLFTAARSANLILELDRLCRLKALENFKLLYEQNKNILLFLNMDVSVLDMNGVLGSDFLFNNATNIGIPPQNIVIEFSEERVKDTKALKIFVTNYRNYGFLIALDNIGAANSNLDRFFMLRPEIIKIDRKIVESLDSNSYKQDIFKALADLSMKTGALVIAVGIETENEALSCLELGANMLQGFFFCEPKENSFEKALNKTAYIASSFREYITHKFKSKIAHEKIYDKILSTMTRLLSASPPEGFDDIIYKYVGCYPLMDCIYILKEDGIQVSDTVINPDKTFIRRAPLFSPSKAGTNHEGKEYFYYIKNMGLNKYITNPYISMLSGTLCITLSQAFRDITGDRYYLCIDISSSHVEDLEFNNHCSIN